MFGLCFFVCRCGSYYVCYVCYVCIYCCSSVLSHCSYGTSYRHLVLILLMCNVSVLLFIIVFSLCFVLFFPFVFFVIVCVSCVFVVWCYDAYYGVSCAAILPRYVLRMFICLVIVVCILIMFRAGVLVMFLMLCPVACLVVSLLFLSLVCFAYVHLSPSSDYNCV